MAQINLNFSGVSSREPLPEGLYELQVAKVEQTVSKASGNPMLKIEFNVLTEGYEGRKIWSNYVLTENMYWKVQELFKSLGLDADGIVDIDTDDMIGLTCTGKITQREYQGDIQNELKKTL